MKYTVQHTGYPVAGRPIQDDEWQVLSTHKTYSAACKRIIKERSHLDIHSWDDHYRIIDPNGDVVSMDRYIDEQAEKHYRKLNL
jgi:hypothetical protein